MCGSPPRPLPDSGQDPQPSPNPGGPEERDLRPLKLGAQPHLGVTRGGVGQERSASSQKARPCASGRGLRPRPRARCPVFRRRQRDTRSGQAGVVQDDDERRVVPTGAGRRPEQRRASEAEARLTRSPDPQDHPHSMTQARRGIGSPTADLCHTPETRLTTASTFAPPVLVAPWSKSALRKFHK